MNSAGTTAGTSNVEHIDIGSIMLDIRQEIQKKGYTDDEIDFEDNFDEEFLSKIVTSGDGDSLEQDFNNIYYSWNVELYKPLPGGKLAIFIKKAIRRVLKFYLVPVFNDQKAFNCSVARILIEQNHRLEAQVASLCDRIASLEKLAQIKKHEK